MVMGDEQSEGSKGNGVTLHSLAPEFNAEYHGVYLATLKDAIENHPEVRNVALTGAYGTGKSSILAEVAKRDRVVGVSLCSVGDLPETLAGQDPGSTISDEQTNLI